MQNKPTQSQSPLTDALLRLPDVLAAVGVSRSTWWAWCREGRAPKPLKIGPRVTAWRASDIEAFIKNAGRQA